MDLLRMFQVLGRRWFIAVPVILIGAYLTNMVAKDLPPQYRTAGSFIVVDAADASGSIKSEVIARAVQDAEISDRIAKEQGTGSYVVTVEKGNMVITASSRFQANPPKIANAVLEEIKNVIIARRAASGSPVTTAEEAGFEQLNRAGASAAWNQGRKLYEATASARMQAGTEDAIGINSAKTMILNELDGSRVRNSIARQGGLDDYKVEAVKDTTTITYIIANSDKAKVTKTAELLLDAAPLELKRLQEASGRSQNNLTVNRLGGVSEPIEDTKGILRSVIGLIAVTLVAAVLLSFIAESIAEGIASRRRRRERMAPRQNERPRHEGPRPLRPVGGDSTGTGTAPIHTVAKRPAPAPDNSATHKPQRYFEKGTERSEPAAPKASAPKASSPKSPVAAARPEPRSNSAAAPGRPAPAASPQAPNKPTAPSRPSAKRPGPAAARPTSPAPITPPNVQVDGNAQGGAPVVVDLKASDPAGRVSK